jgi:Uncharacterized protein conserved in bacteria (DUF2330)
VTVLTQKQVGPYETVQLKSTDGSALTKWLEANGFAVPAADKPVIAAYVAEGMNFLALKLVPGAGVSAMQPVRVTTPGALPALPLRMVSVGTGARTGITLWVVASGRWEPKNFPFFTIADADLTWDWTTLSSNYEVVRSSKEAALGYGGFQIESSLELSEHTIWGEVMANVASDGDAGGGYLSSPDAGPDASGVAGSMEEAAFADLTALFAGVGSPNARITRLRGDIAHSALKNDLVLQASGDPRELSNQLIPTKQAGPGCRYEPDGGLATNGGAGTSGSGGGGSGPPGHGGAGGSGSEGTGARGSAGSAGSAGADDAGSVAQSGGCGCRTAAEPSAFDLSVVGVLAFGGLGTLRSVGKRRPKARRREPKG